MTEGEDTAVLPPWWHYWHGVNGQHYARLPRSVPPLTLRRRTLPALKRAVAAFERAWLERAA